MKAPVYLDLSRTLQFVYGCLVALFTVALFGLGAYFLLAFLKETSVIAYVLVGAVLLKTSFSVRALRSAAVKVKHLLVASKLPEARSAVRALVGRNAADLDEKQIVSATVESVAENTCDSFVAPLFYFLFLGVPGALAYRAINTLDNSIGFRGKYEYLGKFAARLDDVANFVPARISAFVFVLAAMVCKKDAASAWHIMFRDHGKTASPNGGWTMGAMAGALGVSLEKPGHYRLGDGLKSLLPATVDGSLRVVVFTVVVWTLVTLAGRWGWYVVT
jgi:adenosylcobinamide-phosphate synthase